MSLRPLLEAAPVIQVHAFAAMGAVGVLRAHWHDVAAHRRTMLGLFIGGLVIAGGFTFVPGRIMYHVAFGP